MTQNPYKKLAERLDATPNGFPPTEDGAELRLLQKVFTPEEAELASQLRLVMETPAQIIERIGGEIEEITKRLKGMRRKGLVEYERREEERLFGLMPFVIGFWENQMPTLDAELAHLFEDYYRKGIGQAITISPSVHRVIPVGESVRTDMEVEPYESAIEIVNSAKAWAVWDCICRKQQALIGDPCEHQVDNCMIFSQRPGVFDGSPIFTAITRDESLATLQKAAEDGLVHSVNNHQEDMTYICNCCNCACGFLRGMVDLGLANVVARSAFVNIVEEDLCTGCELCLDHCQFEALSMGEKYVAVDGSRCVGCGVCIQSCQDEALALVRRPEDEIMPVPVTQADWQVERAAARGIELNEVM
jgi:Na+-translocating ferredoxin:NAD+ oxidoreductase RNF subunit RnfB